MPVYDFCRCLRAKPPLFYCRMTGAAIADLRAIAMPNAACVKSTRNWHSQKAVRAGRTRLLGLAWCREVLLYVEGLVGPGNALFPNQSPELETAVT